ncbi:cytochrome P450 [Corallococcus praedator]|uniref:Cytochrome P450 n=1 Tax=Corallococcus praedator TaxID=2316724 RepID=A0ABX9QSD0_9BACT|nr:MULTISPECIES: cytochrome P450 [Corallococcus]RKH35904.1 cytochrome P450 [Corallococcus sp. CA031C]RKI17632.1 cytochrome P450 [Corallococcus praedator]
MSDSYPLPKDWQHPLDPPPDYKRLRQEAPVCPVRMWDGKTPWLVSRYQDVLAVLSDPRLVLDSTLPGFPHISPSSSARQGRPLPFFLRPDAEYRVQRAMLVQEFLPRRMELLRPSIQRTVDAALDAMLAGPRPVDLMGAFALPVALQVICDLLGVPHAGAERLHVLSRTIGSRASSREEATQALVALDDFFLELVEANLREPTDTLIGRVVAEQVATGRLSAPDAASMFHSLFYAGHGPPAYMFGLGTLALLLDPGQLEKFREMEDPAAITAAVQELLRFINVSHLARQRVATVDVTIGGQLIRAGEGILAQPDSANRDETVFSDPDRLDLHREVHRHFAFGHGIHLCTGRALSLIEFEVVFKTLFQRIPTLRLAVPPEEVRFKKDENLLGVHELPVTWEPASLYSPR